MDFDISRLRERRAPIDMSPDEFRAVGHQLVDDIVSFLSSIRERPVNYNEQPSDIKALLPAGLPDEGTDPGALLGESARLLFNHSLLNGHPRFLGYITSSPAPIGMLGDLLAASVNANVGGWSLSPVATEIEKQSLSWIAEMIGYPSDGGGVFVSGGNMANFVCFIAARRAMADWNVREKGLGGDSGRLLVYASPETHVWIHKAMDFFGHGSGNIRPIPVSADQRADIESLHKEIEDDRRRGDHPFMIVGTAGTVATGAIDPLRNMATVAKEYGLWFHVDGAYGGLAAALPDASADLKALALADSVVVDPHKWLYSPLEAGAVLVRDPAALPNAFRYHPTYYHFESQAEIKTNFYEHGFQNSRGFRALKVWLGIRQVGRSGYIQMISDDIALSKELFRLCEAAPELEALTQGLSIATFRFVPERLAGGERDEEYLNDLNERTLTRMWESGETFLSNAVIDGKFVLRACIVNFRTSLEDVEALPEIVLRHGRAVDDELRAR